MKEIVLKLYEVARSRKWRPWELQDELKKIYPGVVAVGDDLSFTVKLPSVRVDERRILELGGRPCRIHPFRKAYRFDRGFIAFQSGFLRVSRDIDKSLLEVVLEDAEGEA